MTGAPKNRKIFKLFSQENSLSMQLFMILQMWRKKFALCYFWIKDARNIESICSLNDLIKHVIFIYKLELWINTKQSVNNNHIYNHLRLKLIIFQNKNQIIKSSSLSALHNISIHTTEIELDISQNNPIKVMNNPTSSWRRVKIVYKINPAKSPTLLFQHLLSLFLSQNFNFCLLSHTRMSPKPFQLLRMLCLYAFWTCSLFHSL